MFCQVNPQASASVTQAGRNAVVTSLMTSRRGDVTDGVLRILLLLFVLGSLHLWHVPEWRHSRLVELVLPVQHGPGHCQQLYQSFHLRRQVRRVSNGSQASGQ